MFVTCTFGPVEAARRPDVSGLGDPARNLENASATYTEQHSEMQHEPVARRVEPLMRRALGRRRAPRPGGGRLRRGS